MGTSELKGDYQAQSEPHHLWKYLLVGISR